MPFRELNRQQIWMLPPTLDELIPNDHPARFIAAFVDSLDKSFWDKLGIGIDGEPLGAPAYHPRALLGVWLYGFMTSTRSSRKLETACRDQIPYLWLTGWQRPDHNTLWRFYKEHRKNMRHLFKLTVRTAVKLDLVDLAVQAIDGTKIAGNASRDRTYDRKGLKRLLERTDKAINELEQDNNAGNDAFFVHLPEKLRKAKYLRNQVKEALDQLADKDGQKRINLTDNDAVFMKSRQGIVTGYNMESVASPLKTNKTKTSGMLLTGLNVVSEQDDHYQLIPMLKQSEEMTGKLVEITLADAGYHSGANPAICEQRKQMIIMPESQEQRLKSPYHKDNFIYNSHTDCYGCPKNQSLRYMETRTIANKEVRVYGGLSAVCRKCPAFGKCTKNRYRGREILIGQHDEELRRHRTRMLTEKAKIIYKRRKEIIEPAFGIIKEQMGVRRFLLRGLDNVKNEAETLATAFNLRTLCTIFNSGAFEKRRLLIVSMSEIGIIVRNLFVFLCISRNINKMKGFSFIPTTLFESY